MRRYSRESSYRPGSPLHSRTSKRNGNYCSLRRDALFSKRRNEQPSFALRGVMRKPGGSTSKSPLVAPQRHAQSQRMNSCGSKRGSLNERRRWPTYQKENSPPGKNRMRWRGAARLLDSRQWQTHSPVGQARHQSRSSTAKPASLERWPIALPLNGMTRVLNGASLQAWWAGRRMQGSESSLLVSSGRLAATQYSRV